MQCVRHKLMVNKTEITYRSPLSSNSSPRVLSQVACKKTIQKNNHNINCTQNQFRFMSREILNWKPKHVGNREEIHISRNNHDDRPGSGWSAKIFNNYLCTSQSELTETNMRAVQGSYKNIFNLLHNRLPSVILWTYRNVTKESFR